MFMSKPVWPAGHYVSGLSVLPSFLPSVRPSAPSKSYAFSTNYHACITMPTWHRCDLLFCWPWPPNNLFPRSCLTWIFSVNFYWWVQLCVQHPAFSTNCHACIAMPTWPRCAPPICFDLDIHITSSRGRVQLWFSLSIFTDGYNFAGSTQQNPCLFKKLSCMHCNANMT